MKKDKQTRPVIIRVERDRYSTEGATLTVAELIEQLQNYPANAAVYVEHDNGYSYSALHEESIRG